MKKILAFALAAFAFSAIPAAAQITAADTAYMERAWADGRLDATEKEAYARIQTKGAVAQAAKVATMKIAPDMRSYVYYGQIGSVDQKTNPWREVTSAYWNQMSPEFARSSWATAARADYDGDGKPDEARIYVNGKQTGVLVRMSSNPSRPVVIWKNDGIEAGAQIYAAGRRFYLSVPDSSPIILYMDKGKPAVAVLGD